MGQPTPNEAKDVYEAMRAAQHAYFMTVILSRSAGDAADFFIDQIQGALRKMDDLNRAKK